MRIITFIILLYSIFLCSNTSAQNIVIDSLKKEINSAAPHETSALLSQIADEYLHISTEVSEKYIRKSLTAAIKTNNKKLLPEIYRITGIIKYKENQNDSALYYFYKSIKYADQLNSVIEVASAKVNIGGIFLDTKEYEKALDSYLEAGIIFKQEGEKENEAIVYNNIGLIYQQTNEPDSALKYFQMSIDRKKELGNLLGEAYTKLNIAKIYYLSYNNYRKAETTFNQALDVLTESLDTLSIAILYNNYGDLYKHKKEYKEAKIYYNKSLDISIPKKSFKLQAYSYLMLYEIASNNNDFRRAINFHKLYVASKDSLNLKVNKRILSELKIKYETEKKEEEIQHLNNEQILKDKQIELQKRIISILILSSIIIFCFLIVVFFQKRKQKQTNKNLVQRNLEIMNSERELHEIKSKLKTNNKDKKSNSILQDNQEKKILIKIEQAFNIEQVYLDRDININVFSKSINTNKTYVSHAINKNYKMNFSSFINQYRIKEARILFAEDNLKKLTIEAIANQVGFNSVTAFNKAFKKYTGLTPSAFAKNLPKA